MSDTGSVDLGGSVIGVVIAVLLLVLIIIVLFVMFIIKRRRKRFLYDINESYQITGRNLANPIFNPEKRGSQTSAQEITNQHYDFASELPHAM